MGPFNCFSLCTYLITRSFLESRKKYLHGKFLRQMALAKEVQQVWSVPDLWGEAQVFEHLLELTLSLCRLTWNPW